MKRDRAFTLIELLVVVAIIAVLISILLPALGRSREQARVVRCATNIRSIALGCTVYSTDNAGANILEFVKSGSPVYANGFFWANELLNQGYVKTANNLDDQGVNMIVERSSNAVYYCPDCILGTMPSGAGWTQNFPRDLGNQIPNHQATPKVGVPGNIRVYTWYGLNSSITKNNDMGATPSGSASTGAGATPFIDYSSNTGTPPATGDPRYQRTARQVLAPSRMVMVMEAPSDDQYPGPTPQSKAPCLRGIHGDVRNNGMDGDTNFAFFDGHVSKYSTVPYSQNGYCPTPGTTNPMQVTVQDTVFFLQQQ